MSAFLSVSARGALAVVSAQDAHLKALAVFFLAVTFPAVAALVVELRGGIEDGRERERVARFDRVHDFVSLDRVLGLVPTVLTLTLDRAELALTEALAVELQTVGVFAGAEEPVVWGLRTVCPLMVRALRQGLLQQTVLLVAEVIAEQLFGVQSLRLAISRRREEKLVLGFEVSLGEASDATIEKADPR